jgi:hypothetical protein
MQSQFHFVIYLYIKGRIKFIQKISKRDPFQICPETTMTECDHPKQKLKIVQNNYFSKKINEENYSNPILKVDLV